MEKPEDKNTVEETETKKPKKQKRAKKVTKGAIILIIGIIIILIPCGIFGGILLSAYLQTGSPVIADRFENDLSPAILDSDSQELTDKIKALSAVEDCTINLTSAQYRINVDVNDGLSSEEIEELTVDIYNIVNQVLPVNTYFTATGSKKMYDLSINVYNCISDDGMIYFILTKNSQMETYSIQEVSKPVDEELAKDLRGEGEEAQEETVE